MPKKRNPVRSMDLMFPVGGVVERFGYQKQPPFTTPSALNVRPYDAILGRERGGSRPGLVGQFVSESGNQHIPFNGGLPIQCMQAVGYVLDSGEVKRKLVAIAGGKIYYDSFVGLTLASEGPLRTTGPISASQHGNVLLIADYRTNNIQYQNGTITVDSGTGERRLSSPSITNWLELSPVLNTSMDVCFVDNGKDPESDTYAIASVFPTYIVLTAPSLTAGACNFQINRPLRVFDPIANTITAMANTTYGCPPLGSTIVQTWRDRAVCAGPGPYWFMSRIGDYQDWDYGGSPDDESRAVAGQLVATTSPGTVTEPVTAVIPHTEDQLIIGCENSVWFMRGDPAAGGQLDAISREVGILTQTSWCKSPDSAVVFLSRGGLYIIPPGQAPYPQPLSSTVMPRELIDVDYKSNTINMAYDLKDRGVHLYITPNDGSPGTHWWIDWTLKSYWPVTLPATKQPTALAIYAVDATDPRRVLLGCNDGVIRKYSDEATDDDGTAIASHVMFGPIPLSASMWNGNITEMKANMASDSGTVHWSCSIGGTPEEAVTASPAESGTFTEGDNYRAYPRCQGSAATLEIYSTDAQWAMEVLSVNVRQAGKER